MTTGGRGRESTTDLQLFKWVGGKGWLLPTLDQVIPPEVIQEAHHYVEPFLGGASMFRWMERKRGTGISYVLGDGNRRLINTYQAISDGGTEQADAIAGLYEAGRAAYGLSEFDKHRRSPLYYSWRSSLNTERYGVVSAAVLMLLCNRAGFRGLYRENKAGLFNVPFGAYAKLPDLKGAIEDFRLASRSAEFTFGHWKWINGLPMGPGWFLYLDPPYSGTYCGYGSAGWTFADDTELATEVQRLTRAGVSILWSLPDNEHGRRCVGLAPPTSLLEVAKSGVVSVGDRVKQHELLASYNFKLSGGSNG